MKRLYGLLICGLLLPGLVVGGCAFKMGGGSPAPRPSDLISASIPSGQDNSLVQSAQVIPYDTDKLILGSDCIILGQVAEILPSKEYPSSAGESMQHNIYTDIIINVERDFWGGESKRVIVRVQGGKIGNLVMWAEDVPLFARGEKALFFLYHPRPDQAGPSPSSAENGSYYLVTGAMQGKYEYQSDAFSSMSGQTITAAELEQKIAKIHNK